MGWLILTYKLPSDHSRVRVAVWREVRRSGALHLQQSVVAFPDTAAFESAVEHFRALVAEVGGETLALRSEPIDHRDQARLVDAWNRARDEEYAELLSECDTFLAEIEHEFAIEKFTLAELDEEEAELDKLERWRRRIGERDVHAASGAMRADAALERASEALGRYSEAVLERTPP